MTKRSVLVFIILCSTYSCKKNTDISANTNILSFPEIQCNGEIPDILKQELGSHRLAQPSDFVSTIRSYEDEDTERKLTCSIFSYDFNQDNLLDYALLSVSPNKDQFRFMILLNQNNQDFEKAVIQEYKSITKTSGIIYTSMNLKLGGESGLMERAYSPLKPNTQEGKIFKENPAIELWEAIKSNQDDVPQNIEISTLSYCSKAFYFDQNRFKTFVVCD